MKRLLTAAMACVVVLLAGCSNGGASPSPSVSAGGILNVRLTGDWDTLDPGGTVVPAVPAQEIILGTYDRLIAYAANGDAEPYVARSWKFPDASTVVFDLRTDVTCTDGTPVTPSLVANSFARLFKGPIPASAFGPGTPQITADDAAHTVGFRWPNPNADGFFGFATAYASIVCPAGLASTAKLKDTPAGSGPYVLSSAIHGASATLVKNHAWKWGPGGLTAAQLPDSITLQVVANDTTAANELISGQLDVATVQGPDVDRLIGNKSLAHTATASYKLAPLTLNATAGHPTADPQLRRAIMTAIDPAAWNQAAYRGRGVTGTSIFSKQALCYEPGTAKLMPKPSLAAAKQILTAAGYTIGADGKLAKDGKPVNLNVIGSPAQWGNATEYIATQLTSLGFNVSLADIDRASWVARLRVGNYDVSMFPMPTPNIPSWLIADIAGSLPPKGTNFAYTVDATADADEAAALSASPASRCQAWSKWQLDVLRDYDMLPLAASTSDLFTQQRLTAVPVQALYDTSTLRRSA